MILDTGSRKYTDSQTIASITLQSWNKSCSRLQIFTCTIYHTYMTFFFLKEVSELEWTVHLEVWWNIYNWLCNIIKVLWSDNIWQWHYWWILGNYQQRVNLGKLAAWLSIQKKDILNTDWENLVITKNHLQHSKLPTTLMPL